MVAFYLHYPISGYAYMGERVITIDTLDGETAAKRLYTKLRSSSRFSPYLEDTSMEDFTDWVLSEEGFKSGSFEAQVVELGDIEELS